jgi:hypothetical protein
VINSRPASSPPGETAQLLDGPATFRNRVDVMPDLHGDPNEAGFVQIMQTKGPIPTCSGVDDQNSNEWPRSP